MAESKWTIALLITAGGLLFSAIVGYLLGEFVVGGIDPTLAAVYHSAPPVDSVPQYADVDSMPDRGRAYVIQSSYASFDESSRGPDFGSAD